MSQKYIFYRSNKKVTIPLSLGDAKHDVIKGPFFIRRTQFYLLIL